MAIKHLFFDLDHTLWDFERNAFECIEEIFDENQALLPAGLNAKNFYDSFSKLNQSMWHQLDAKEITHEYLREHRFKNAFKALGFEISKEDSLAFDGYFLKKLPLKNYAINGAIDLLNNLKGRFGLHIVSNGYLAIQTQKMQNAGLFHFFEHIVTYDVANSRKPEKAMYEHALNLAQCTPDEVIMIGDSYIADIVGAENAGIRAVHYDPSATSEAKFQIQKLQDLHQFLD